MRASRRLEVHDPELEPEASRPDRDRLLSVRDAQLGPTEDIDDVDGSRGRDGRRQRRMAGQPCNLGLTRVHRNHLVADGSEIPHDAIRGSRRVGGCPDDGDSPRGPEECLDRRVFEEGDPEAAFLYVQDVAKALIRGQVRASFAYGWPSAAGATERPMKPASTTIVTM